ncbi:hypothetical protein HK105_203592 [Polyrhizophydium stewartii]|uniref:EF-hand domain-containing protein n=1 Tax=Polyrhizophydium stewartii TaxID=2732419 RepID=A0ABR4NBA9_9FUNG
MTSRPAFSIYSSAADANADSGDAATGGGSDRPERVPRIAPRSQALIYEVQLKEAFEGGPKTPSRERVMCCFRILGDLVPQAGTFSPVLKVIKDELERSVFSKGLTSADREPFVERIPFFSLVDRIDQVRAAESQRTHAVLDDLHQKLKFRDHDLQILYKKNLVLKQEISEHENHQKRLREDIARLESEIQRHEREKNEIRMASIREEDELKKQIEQLQANLTQSNTIIEKLTMFKAAYNDASDASKLEDELNNNKHDLVVDSKAGEASGMLSYDLHQAKQLQRQFAEILDFQLDDFDATLAQIRKKREIMQGVTNGPRLEVQDAETFEKELDDLSRGFQNRMSQLLAELKLLEEHTSGLKLIQSKFEEQRNLTTVDRLTDMTLRKYAAVLQYSLDGGESFASFSDTKFCANDVESSSGTQKRADDDLDPDSVETEDENRNASKTFLSIWGEYYHSRKGFKPTLNRAYPLQKLLSFIQEIYDMRWALEEKYDETGVPEEAGLPRFIVRPLLASARSEKCVLIYSRLQDFFYKIIFDRYQIPEIALKAAHDVFHGLQQHEKSNQIVGIFVLHLSGEEDVLWKYHYMARKLIFSRQEPMDMARYRQTILIMYPNQPREMYDQMELEYTAFCKNKVSRESIEDHLIHMMSTGIEPNFKFVRNMPAGWCGGGTGSAFLPPIQFLSCFQRFDYQKKGFMSYEDFDEALTQILPSASNRERRVRFKLAELDCRKDAVPIHRLAHIAAYIIMYSCYKSKWAMQSLISPDFVEHMTGKEGGR